MSEATPRPGKERITHQGKIVEVVQYDVEVAPGEIKTFEKARRAPGIRLIIPTPNGGVLLTKERRHELDGYDYRLAGGKVFDTLEEYNQFLKSGADILIPAHEKVREEALQEVGIHVNKATHSHTSICGATVDWDLLYFVVDDYTSAEQQLELGEDIEVLEVSRDEAREMCLDGRMSEERSAIALLRYLPQGS